MADENVRKTGTTTVAIKCKDAVVFLADKRATLGGGMIIDHNVEKIVQISENMGITTAGHVSAAQLFVKLIKAELALNKLRTGQKFSIKAIANMLGGMLQSHPRLAHFLFGGYEKEPALFDIFPDGSVTDIKEYIASGSGSVFAYGVLDSSYSENMTVEQAIEMGARAIDAAVQRDTASGDGLDVVVIDKNGYSKRETKRIKRRQLV